LRIEFVHRAAALPPALWNVCFPPPLEGLWWYRTLEASGLEDQFTFLYAAIHEDARPVGIAPVFVMDLRLEFLVPEALVPLLWLPGKLFPGLARPRILFVGSPCADEGTLGLVPGVDRRAVMLCLQDALAAKARELGASMIVWKDFPAGLDGDLAWLAGQRGLFRMVSFPGTRVDLPSRRKEDYFAGLKGSRRHQLRKKLRRSRDTLDLDVEVVQRPDAATMERIVALFMQTYEKAETKFERLDRRFFAAVAQEPVSRFLVLREKATREVVAFMLCFDLGERVINKFIGLDYSRPKDGFLLFRLWEAAVDWALERGASSIQSGQTGYRAKIEQGHRLVPLTNYCQHRSPLVHRVCAMVARRIGWRTLDDDLALFVEAHPEADRSAESAG
jgi:hypothetical protein